MPNWESKKYVALRADDLRYEKHTDDNTGTQKKYPKDKLVHRRIKKKYAALRADQLKYRKPAHDSTGTPTQT